MSHKLPALLLCLGLLSGCGAGASADSAAVSAAALTVTSASISDGKLLTATAANRAPNDPLGQNQSPQLSWSAVDGAVCYAVLLFDTDANWLHWCATDLTQTSLAQGAETDEARYVGPYPPANTGAHHYTIEVFALKQPPTGPVGNLDAKNTYADLVRALDGDGGAILARGSVSGSYTHGDHTT